MRVQWLRDAESNLCVFDMSELLLQSNDGTFPDGRMLKARVENVEVHVLAPTYMSPVELEASLV